jgi:uncharacterized protein (TIRG00374 family)
LGLLGFIRRYRSVILIIAGNIAFILYLYFFVGFGALADFLSKLNLYDYALFYSLAVVALILSVIFDSMIWHSLLKPLSVKIQFRKLFFYNWIGNFIEMVIPCETVCGEVTRIYLAQKETSSDAGIAVVPVISSRIISTFVYTSGLLIGFVSLIATHSVPLYLDGVLALIVAGTAAVIGIIFYLAFKEEAAVRLVDFLMRLAKIITKNQARLEELKAKLTESFSSFSNAFKIYKEHPKYLIQPIIYAIIAWMFSLLVYLLVFYSLNFKGISIIDLTLIYCVTATVETVTAGFPVGAVELTLLSLYSVYGVPLVIAGAATTLTRLLTFWIQVLIGYPIIQFTGFKHVLKGGFFV